MTDQKEKTQDKKPDEKAKSPDEKAKSPQVKQKAKPPQLWWFFVDIVSFLAWKRDKAAGKMETWDEFSTEFEKWDKAERPEVTPERLAKIKKKYGGDKAFKSQIQQVMWKMIIPLVIMPLFRQDKNGSHSKIHGGGGPSQKKGKPPADQPAPEKKVESPPKKEVAEPKPSKPKVKPVVVSSGFSLGRDIKTTTGDDRKDRPPLTDEKKAELKEKWLESQRAKEIFTATSRDKCQGHF